MTDENNIEVARDLARTGVPIFLARRADTFPHGGHNGTGYWLPGGWEQTVADPAALDAWRPGMAVCAVMGRVVDGLDVDAQKGGTESLATLNGSLPRSYGRQTTPSGGTHDLIATLGVRSRDGLLPGVDVKAGKDGRGHGFLFLAPTEKASKVTGEVARYEWAARPDLSPLLRDGDASGAGLAARLTRGTPERAEYDGPEYADLSPRKQSRADDYVFGFVQRWGERLKQVAALDEGETDERGHGWEQAATNCAFEFMRVALAPWNLWEVEDAQEAYHGLLPHEVASNEACRGKWDEARLARAADEPTWEPPWLAFPDAEDEFEAVEPEDEPTGAWEPRDLAATVAGLLDGTITRPEPTIGSFGDGCLFYPGRINSVHGDSTGGKTWTALVTAKQEMERGETVVYVDLEDTAAGVVSRLLLDLGVAPAVVSARFVYLHPDEPLTPEAARGLAALLDARRPSLVVVDSTGEALAIEGANPNADEEVAKWFRRLPRLAVKCGAAVLLLDHATKAGNNDLWPIGSQRKRAAITGAAYLQKVATPFGKGKDGKSVLICAKDRHGNYPLRTRVAALSVRGGAVNLEAEPGTTGSGGFRPTGYMEKVCRWLEQEGSPQSKNQVEQAGLGNKKHVTDALARLVAEKYVAVQTGPRNAQQHTVVRPFREGASDFDD